MTQPAQNANAGILASAAPSFVVADPVRAAEYYRDTFGFVIRGYFMDPPVYAIVQRDGIQIHFGRGDKGGMPSHSEWRRGGIDAYIYVLNVDELHREFVSRGADILEGPIDRIYDRREIVVRDCHGFILAFGQ